MIGAILQENDLHFAKQFGQNFLIDENIVTKIAEASDVGPEDTVLEVGPGLGTLTRELAARAGQVYTVEIDKKLIPVLMGTLSDLPNVGLINADILKLDFQKLLADEKSVKIAANLPYYITTPVIMGFLESDIPFSRMTFLVQKEVGERLCAVPGTKAYGALSIAAQYYADIEPEFYVPAGVFMPKPKVDSVVISLTKKTVEGPEHKTDKKLFLKLVKAGFANRRKTLINSLSQNSGYPKETLLQALDAAEISPGIRAEKLTAADFARLTDAVINLEQAGRQQ